MGINKRCLAALVTVVMVVGMPGVSAALGNSHEIPALTQKAAFMIGSKTVTVDGQTWQMDVAPYIDSNGRTMVPVRYLGDLLGCAVTWDRDTRTAHLFSSDRADFYLTAGNSTITFGGGTGRPFEMDTVPVLDDPPGRLFVSVRWVAELLPYQVRWDAASVTVTLVALTLTHPGDVIVYAPDIYLYPLGREDMRVQLGNSGNVTISRPVYPPGGWRVTAFPDGRITANGVGYGHLWYEAVVTADWQNRSGWLVTGDRDGFLAWAQNTLPSLGLNSGETNDFTGYWRTHLPQAPYYIVAPQETPLVDQAMPLQVTPVPQTVIRLWLFVEPLSHPDKLLPPVSARAPVRRGLTVVEWGVVMKKAAK